MLAGQEFKAVEWRGVGGVDVDVEDRALQR